MPSIYQPRRPRASPLWQLVNHGWSSFVADYEKTHRPILGPLKSATIATVESFLRCGDLASGFTRLECFDCGHERLLAFTCKTRHFCPACHQRRVRSTSEWIAGSVCHQVPHRQVVFTIPKVLRGIFRKRRPLLSLLFQSAIDTLTESFRLQLGLAEGKLGAVAAVHTFGDYLVFHPHLHVLVADGLFAPDGRFHCLPQGAIGPMTELFRHRFLAILREKKLISPSKLSDLLGWKHSGFHVHDGRDDLIAADNRDGRKRLAEYLLRHPFSLQKITWNATSKTVIYRSKRHHNTKRNFEIFKAPDFIAAALLHLPPKGQQTVRYYGVYSNKVRGRKPEKSPSLVTGDSGSSAIALENPTSGISNLSVVASAKSDHQSELLLVEPPPKRSARLMRPLWRDLILQVWGGDPLKCPCCTGTMKVMRPTLKREEVEFFLRLHGLWEGLVRLPRPPPPPFDIESLQRIEPPWRAIKEWIPDDEPNLNWFNQPRNARAHSQEFEDIDQSPTWQPEEIQLDEGRTLLLEYT